MSNEPQPPPAPTDDRLEQFLGWMNGFKGNLVIAAFAGLVYLWRGEKDLNLIAALGVCAGLAVIGAEIGRRIETRFLGSKTLRVKGLEVLRLYLPLVILAVLMRQVLTTIGSSREVVEGSIGLMYGVLVRGVLVYSKRWGE
jgi:hypothetical protein